ncbi:hypothetical protein JCM10021v2_002151 [Rhodotorula toruloides]
MTTRCGGYCEREDERGYTFQWFHLCDTFIYFSHHRVSCPPSGWIRSAHVNGTKILGTLIFEWDAGREDIVELVAPTSPTAKRFSSFSTRYADLLVDVAVERGFDGWLVNVEVDLGSGSAKEGAKEHTRVLLDWLVYFQAALKKRIPHAEVVWYDSVTTEGKLAWQNCVNELNRPFFLACDSIFLNYWWRSEQLAATSQEIQQTCPGRVADVCVGIDVFGRGTLAGGGFESWRAAHAICTATQASQTPSEAGFSVALFAPGWTVEAESLGHSLATPNSFAKWAADDAYLWSHGSPTPSVPIEAARQERERREQRGVLRARQLAASLAPSASPLPISMRIPDPPTFDYEAPLDPLPGSELGVSHRPLASFFSPRPIPCPDFRFYTNFCAGSGHRMFVSGREVDRSDTGWTDVAFSYPFPSLLFRTPELDGVNAAATEEHAWEGSRAVEVKLEDAHDNLLVPFFPLALPPLPAGIELEAWAIWKSIDGLDTTVAPVISDDSASLSRLSVDTASTGSKDWLRTTVMFRCADGTPTNATYTLSVRFSYGVILVGAMGVRPVDPASARPVLASLEYLAAESLLRWQIDYVTASASTASPAPLAGTPFFQHFHLFVRDKAGDKRYLGTTFETEFAIARQCIEEAEAVIIQGVDEAGRLEQLEQRAAQLLQ